MFPFDLPEKMFSWGSKGTLKRNGNILEILAINGLENTFLKTWKTL